MRHLSTAFIVLTTILFSQPAANAKSKYFTYLNRFGSFSAHANSELIDHELICTNTSDTPTIYTDTANCTDNAFNFHIRMANLNNAENKKYQYGQSGNPTKKISVSNPAWGAVWDYADSRNYYAVKLQCSNSNLHDILDQRSMSLEVIHMDNGVSSVLQKCALDKAVDLGTGFNVVVVDYDGTATTIFIGNKEMRQVCKLDDIGYSGNTGFGCIAYPAAKIKLERAVIETRPLKNRLLETSWTAEKIQDHLNRSHDPIEGYWEYLDRDLEEKKLKLGGRYTIALISDGKSGYDIIYIDGAKVNRSNWHTGMLKGKLRRTRFQDSYDLVWHDAMMDSFTQDVYATVENGIILNLKFPIQKSQLRFSKKE